MEAKANELRIGNYVASSGNPKNEETWVIGKVHSISSMDSQFEQIEVETDEDFTWFFKGNYFGIPLTEKWLLDFGFKTIMVNLYKLSIENWKELYVSLNSDGNVHFYISNGFNEIVIRSGKLCVHHIQNVFHDFTGEELTIKTID